MNATYLHDSDSYMMALLLVCIGFWLSKNIRYGKVVSIVFYILSLGIYQTYIQIAIYLEFILLIKGLFNNKRKDSAREFFLNMFVIAGSMALYFALYRIILLANNDAVFQGVNSAEQALGIFSIDAIKERLMLLIKSEWRWFIYPCGVNANLKKVINIILLLISAFTVVLIALKNKIDRLSCLVIL